jgi:hypothetical protein
MLPSGNKSFHVVIVDEDVDTEVVILIFNGAAIEKPIPSLSFTVAGEEKEKIKLQYKKFGMGDTNLRLDILKKNLL